MVFFRERLFECHPRTFAVAVVFSALACTDADGPRPSRVTITGPTAVMVGDAIQLTANVEAAENVTQLWEAPKYLVAQIIPPSGLYGVGAGTAIVTVKAITIDEPRTIIAEDSVAVTVVPPPASNRPAFVQLTADLVSSCALSADGSTFCWGANSGNRAFAPRCEEWRVHQVPRRCHSVPVKLQGFPQFKYIAGGIYSTCAITTADDAYCWGIGPYNALNTSGAPATVPGGIQFSKISVERGYGLALGSEAEHVCGITTNAQLYCWIRGGSPTNPSLMAGSSYATVSLGGVLGPPGSNTYRACALDTAGAAFCWGTMTLGDGNPSPSSEQTTPVPVGGSLRLPMVPRTVGEGWGHTRYGHRPRCRRHFDSLR
jgi:hypothetical protein